LFASSGAEYSAGARALGADPAGDLAESVLRVEWWS
jgi:hypothetical protein